MLRTTWQQGIIMENKIQEIIFKAMGSQLFYPHKTGTIHQKDTHISKVFLTGEFVYKLKKSVDLGFLDFTTLEKRKKYCMEEVSLNRRLSPDIYTDVAAITLDKGDIRINGKGEIIDYAVKMLQLDDDWSLDSMIKAGNITRMDMVCLGRRLSQFYLETPESRFITPEDHWKTIYNACLENFRHTEPFCDSLLDRDLWEIVRGATFGFLKKRKSWFFKRAENYKVRDCHGDLRCGHIYFTPKGIRIIDCIEFNDNYRHIDIISDLAFLLMALDFIEAPGYGQCILNEFLRHTKDTKALLMLPFYKCYRAFVRCKVNCIFLNSPVSSEKEKQKIHLKAQDYLDLSSHYALQCFRPIIWVVCGVPGTGKSTIARELSKILKMRVFRSDVERKKFFGLASHENGAELFGDKIYSALAGSMVYSKLLCLAAREVEKGESVVLDATYSTGKSRRDVINLAGDKGVKPVFVECTAKEDIIRERLLARDTGPSVSDARVEHFVDLNARYERFRYTGEARIIRVDTARPLEASIRYILTNAFRIHAPPVIDEIGVRTQSSVRQKYREKEEHHV